MALLSCLPPASNLLPLHAPGGYTEDTDCRVEELFLPLCEACFKEITLEVAVLDKIKNPFAYLTVPSTANYGHRYILGVLRSTIGHRGLKIRQVIAFAIRERADDFPCFVQLFEIWNDSDKASAPFRKQTAEMIAQCCLMLFKTFNVSPILIIISILGPEE